jgi:hypothetical protein
MHNRHHNGIAVGVNPFAEEWNLLASLLNQKGKKVVAGDFSNFDGSLNSQVLWSIFHNIYIPWIKDKIDLSEKEYRICFGLWSHLVHSVHIFGDNVYQWTHSQPSGNPMTAILNSIYNNFIIRYAWHLVFKGTNLQSQLKFKKYVYMIAYGDDNVINIADDVIDKFNQITISDALATINHKYTDEGKTGQLIAFRSLEEVQFLKRGFLYNDNLARIVAPLDIATIWEMLNWVRVSKSQLDLTSIVLTNVDVAFRELVYHGPREYEELALVIASKSYLFPSQKPIIRPYDAMLYDVEHGWDVEDYAFF